MGGYTTLLLAAFAAFASAQDCKTIYGNTYCKEVNHISYKGIEGKGTYRDVTYMDPKTCKVDYTQVNYAGPLAPLDEGLSIHFRGPLHLKQFGVYYPNDGKHKKQHGKHGRHGRSLLDSHHEKRGSKKYKRAAYYNAEKGKAEGLVFMNHMGGKGSGSWDTCWGNSISYMDPTCETGSATPRPLKNAPIKSNKEFIIFSDEKCDGSCGYSRPGAPAHKGFAGKNKIFVFEFSMPKDDCPGVPNNNMPSIWALNSKVPRISQYNEISCWKSGCGEFDMFEVLEQGFDYVKSHYHASQGGSNNKGGGGSPDYFKRPYDGPIKAAVVFSSKGSADIMILDKDFEFGDTIDPTACKTKGGFSTFDVPK